VSPGFEVRFEAWYQWYCELRNRDTGGGVSSSPLRLRGQRNGRRSRKHGADASARRSWGNRHEQQPWARDANGACCGATARFFVSGPPWRKTPIRARHSWHHAATLPAIRGAKQGGWLAGKPVRFQAKSRAKRPKAGPP